MKHTLWWWGKRLIIIKVLELYLKLLFPATESHYGSKNMNFEDRNCWAPSFQSIEKGMEEASRLNAGEGDLGEGGGPGHGGFGRAAVRQHGRDWDQVRGLGWKVKDRAGWQNSLAGGIWHIHTKMSLKMVLRRHEVWGVGCHGFSMEYMGMIFR